jgi:hypothetical protein
MVSERKNKVLPKVLSKQAFDDTTECYCGKNLFRFHNTSKNIHIGKCAYIKEEYDTKTKKWVLSKKQPCSLFICYNSTRPVFAQIENKKTINVYQDKNTLEDHLRRLFDFLMVTDRTSIIQEIDLIVKYNLRRQPRKTFYFPTTTLFMKVSHLESYEDYRKRIFSRKIIDYEPKEKVVKNELAPERISVFDEIELSDSESEESELSEEEISDTEIESELSELSEEEIEAEIEEIEEVFDTVDEEIGDDFDYEE